MPLVSVIIPNYNHARYLRQRLDSILNQTFQDLEVIILDDCSTDNSREIIEQYVHDLRISQIVYNTTNGGTSYKQWYKGIGYAKGDLVWIAESDDLCDIHFLEYTVAHFADKEVILTFTRTQYFEDEPQAEKLSSEPGYRKYNGIDFLASELLWGNGIANASMVVFRRNAYLAISDPRWHGMKLAGDWLLWSNLCTRGDIVAVEAVLNYCRRHEACATNRFRKLGCDFIEGVQVLRFGRKTCCNQFDRKRVYNKWYDNYRSWTSECTRSVKIKILVTLCLREPRLGMFFCRKIARRRVKKIIRG